MQVSRYNVIVLQEKTQRILSDGYAWEMPSSHTWTLRIHDFEKETNMKIKDAS